MLLTLSWAARKTAAAEVSDPWSVRSQCQISNSRSIKLTLALSLVEATKKLLA